MPLYEYSGPGGARKEFKCGRPPPSCIVDDGIKYHLLAVQRFQPAGFRREKTQGDEIVAGYHQMERAEGARFRSRYHHEKIKRAWADERTR